MTGVKLTATGPAMEQSRRNPILRWWAERTIKTLLEMGEQRLNKVLSPRPQGVFLSAREAGRGQASTGNYRRNLNSVMKDMVGVLSDGGVVYGPWLEGTSSRNQTTRFKGYFSFRKTRDWLDKQKMKVGGEHIKSTVGKLNGF